MFVNTVALVPWWRMPRNGTRGLFSRFLLRHPGFVIGQHAVEGEVVVPGGQRPSADGLRQPDCRPAAITAQFTVITPAWFSRRMVVSSLIWSQQPEASYTAYTS